MHPQLELLLEIQDLRMQRRGLADGTLTDLEADVFDIEIEDAIRSLDEKVEELEGRLERGVRESPEGARLLRRFASLLEG